LRFQSGRENKGSVMLSAANVKESDLDIKRAQFYLQNAKTNFIRVLGLPMGRDVDIKGSAPEIVEPSIEPNFLDLVPLVPDRVISAAQLKSAEAAVKVSHSLFYPNLGFKGTVGSTGANYFPEDEEKWRVEVSLSWNIFNGAKDYFSSKSAFANKLVAENNLRNVDLDQAAKLRLAFTSFVIAVEDFKVSEAFIDAQLVRAEIARGKYNNGLSTFDDWDIIENDLISRQKNLTEKRRDKAIAEAAWEQAQGRGVLP
jgi:outer membrane protein TolC